MPKTEEELARDLRLASSYLEDALDRFNIGASVAEAIQAMTKAQVELMLFQRKPK